MRPQRFRNSSIAIPIWPRKWRSASLADALHVAMATVSECELIVSWNFKDIVHFEKIPKYNAVNVLNGYGQIDIHSPLEVISHDDP